jgi:hypothetical protein
VETARRALRPDAVRTALAEALDGAPVLSLDAEAEAASLRAWMAVRVHRDGGADLFVAAPSGREAHRALAAGSAAADLHRTLATELAGLLRELEDQAAPDATARHGLIPWEEEPARPVAPARGFHRVEEELLPWPQSPGESAHRPARTDHDEPGDGLSAPPPQSQNL